MADTRKLYPRTGDKQIVYLRNVVTDPAIIVGSYTMYSDSVNNPVGLEKNNTLYHYPIGRGRLIIGRFCSIAHDAEFLFNSANHTLSSFSAYLFPFFFGEWGLEKRDMAESWDNRGDITLGNDVWIRYEVITMAGVTTEGGAITGARVVVTEDVPPCTVTGGTPARPVRKRCPEGTIAILSELRRWDWPEDRTA